MRNSVPSESGTASTTRTKVPFAESRSNRRASPASTTKSAWRGDIISSSVKTWSPAPLPTAVTPSNSGKAAPSLPSGRIMTMRPTSFRGPGWSAGTASGRTRCRTAGSVAGRRCSGDRPRPASGVRAPSSRRAAPPGRPCGAAARRRTSGRSGRSAGSGGRTSHTGSRSTSRAVTKSGRTSRASARAVPAAARALSSGTRSPLPPQWIGAPRLYLPPPPPTWGWPRFARFACSAIPRLPRRVHGALDPVPPTRAPRGRAAPASWRGAALPRRHDSTGPRRRSTRRRAPSGAGKAASRAPRSTRRGPDRALPAS